jgi:stringent starvation protein B
MDNSMTPHLVVDAEISGVEVPRASVQNGKITLNVSQDAVQGLLMDNDGIDFHARFGGVSQHICVPMHAVLAIYARENGKGMMFPADDEQPDPGGDGHPSPENQGRPHLKVVK